MPAWCRLLAEPADATASAQVHDSDGHLFPLVAVAVFAVALFNPSLGRSSDP
jgi:hypothetical protein